MKIPVDNVVRTYELTCLVPVGYTQSELEKIVKAVDALIKKAGAKVEEHEEWGKKELSYTIKKEGKAHKEAHYYHWVFTSEPKNIEEIRRQIKLNDDLLRELLIVREE